MSASSKKKLRKEQTAAEMTEKQLNEQKEAKKLKAYSIAFISVMVLVLCIAIVVFVSNAYTRSGIAERNTVALTVGEHELNSTEFNYYYKDAINTTYNNWYQSYQDNTAEYVQLINGLDITQPLDEQAYMGDETKTWADYFVELATNNAKSTYALYDAAVAAGRTLTEDEIASIDSELSYTTTMASLYGYGDLETYLKNNYDFGADEESYRAYYEINTLAGSFYNDYATNLALEDSEIEAFNEEYFDNYSSFTYASYYLYSDMFLEGGTTDEEGNTTYSEEEKAAALEKARTTAESLTNVSSIEELDAAIAALNLGDTVAASSTMHENNLYSNVTATMQEWIADENRKAGDVTVLTNESTYTNADGEEVTSTFGYYVVFFESRNDNDMKLINVRHILSSFEGGTTDESGNTVYSETEKKAALDALTEVKNTWESGDATEDSFAALVADNSDDTGSLTTGGLYENVKPGEMVTNFNDWCFDESRKAGDVDIVETEYGYHLMYFVGHSDMTYREFMIDSDLRTQAQEEWYTGLVEANTVSDVDTSKLDLEIILSPNA